MTEEIKIDGIDVSECCFYNNGKCDNPNGMACNCINNAVCYFKELKHLEQENKELKRTKGRCAFKSLDNTFCDEARIKIDKLELDKDCLKVSLETARKYRGVAEVERDKYRSAFEEINLILDELKQQYDYMTDYSEIEEIQNKINEVLQ